MSRFFFALWPDTQTRNAIVKCRSQLQFRGRSVNPSNLHMTLLFIGKMTLNQQQKIIQQAEQIACPAFEIDIDHSGYFNRSQVLWLGIKDVPAPLLELHQALLNSAENCHLPIKQQNYTPHITLARKVSLVSSQTIEPVLWSINSFVLLESIDTNHGVCYKKVKSFTCNNEAN